MKFNFDRKYTQIAVYAVIVIVVSGLLLMWASVLPDISEISQKLASSLAPIVWGIVIAYLLNPGVDFFRTRVFKKWQESSDTPKRRTLIRNVSIFIVVLIALGIITGLLFLIIPQVTTSIKGLVSNYDEYVESFINWVQVTFADQPQILSALENPIEQLQTLISNSWQDISPTIMDFGSKIGGGVISFLLGFKDFIIGFIIAVYFLSSKEMLKAQAKKLLFALMKNSRAQSILTVTRRSNDIFIHYITGILIDAFFVGCCTFIGASIIGTPYPMLIAVIIACTNIIPFFGPFIGGIPCCILVLFVDPIKMLWLAIFFVVLQQFDGNVMVPLIQGGRTGVPSVWVLIGIIVGGGLFGFVGMLLGVPVFAMIYMLFKEFLESRLKKKKLPSEGVIYSRGDIDKYIDGYEYTEEEQKADKEWIEGLTPKKEKKFFKNDEISKKTINNIKRQDKGRNGQNQ